MLGCLISKADLSPMLLLSLTSDNKGKEVEEEDDDDDDDDEAAAAAALLKRTWTGSPYLPRIPMTVIPSALGMCPGNSALKDLAGQDSQAFMCLHFS